MLIGLMLLAVLQPNVEIGQNLTPPALVAGPWEGRVAPDEVAGFSLEIITNADEKVRSLRVDTYVRKAGKTTRTYWSSGDSGSFVMRRGQLRFHQTRGRTGGFDVDLDLAFDSTDMAWTGYFSDGLYSGQVALRRPRMSDAIAPAGTWRTYSSTAIWGTDRVQGYSCLNIGVGQDNALVLWAEDHNMFLGYDNAKHPLFGDSYGTLDDDANASRYADEWSFAAGTGMGGERIKGAMSGDGSAFGGYGEHYGNGVVDPAHPLRAFAWRRMLDFACRP